MGKTCQGSNSKKRKLHNDHEHNGAPKSQDMVTIISKQKKAKLPLNGLTFAVSTLDVKGKKHSSSDSSYQAVAALCTELGGKVTPQVHKKVFAVICNRSAVAQLTQRVRKAVKKKHSLLIDVEWLRQCKAKGCRIDHEEYLLTELAETTINNRSNISDLKHISSQEINVEYIDENDLDVNTAIGWSEPISLDCCCVCHETDRDDCKWCLECNVTIAKKSSQQSTSKII